MTHPVLPLPSQRIFGGIVIASTWLNDDFEWGALNAMIILLNDEPGRHYSVLDLLARDDGYGWKIEGAVDFPNIVPAVEYYIDNGGDY